MVVQELCDVINLVTYHYPTFIFGSMFLYFGHSDLAVHGDEIATTTVNYLM